MPPLKSGDSLDGAFTLLEGRKIRKVAPRPVNESPRGAVTFVAYLLRVLDRSRVEGGIPFGTIPLNSGSRCAKISKGDRFRPTPGGLRLLGELLNDVGEYRTLFFQAQLVLNQLATLASDASP